MTEIVEEVNGVWNFEQEWSDHVEVRKPCGEAGFLWKIYGGKHLFVCRCCGKVWQYDFTDSL